jgi:hypothetical protein
LADFNSNILPYTPLVHGLLEYTDGKLQKHGPK